MYILISEYNYQNNYSYFSCGGKWLESVKKHYPDYAELKKEDIDEILVYSSRKDNSALFARTVHCAGYIADEEYLRINYGEVIEDSEINCGEVRGRVYYLLKRKKALPDDGFVPSVVFLSDIRDYKYILLGKNRNLVNQNLLDQMTGMVQNNDWIGIVRSCPPISRIEQDPIWNDPECLAKLSFALSKLATRNGRNVDPKRKAENTEYFFKTVERCIEIDPYSSMHKSTLAYFLYDRYKQSFDQSDYERAKALYEDLIDTSPSSFKEQYRYANLMREHYYVPANLYSPESYKEFSRVINQYDIVIEAYDKLSEAEKKNQRNNYRKALYQYVGLQYDKSYSRYWDVFFEKVIFGNSVPEYLINSAAAEILKKCDLYIETVAGMSPDEITADNVNDKPSLFDIRYRQAQLSMSKGFWCLLRNYPSEKYISYFQAAKEILEAALNSAKQLSREGVRFNFPRYLKAPLAICAYIQNNDADCSWYYERADHWMRFEYAQILILQGQVDKAKEILSAIPEKDRCRNKANSLLEKIEDQE